MPHPFEKRIIEALWPKELPARFAVWSLLDAARDQRIFGAIDGCHLERCCLFAGRLPWQLQMAAPYLVRLERDHRFTRDLIRNGWGNSWGTYLRTDANAEKLRRHLRRFLRVQRESGGWLLFRYYDPRVLRVFLSTCVFSEARRFFGPIKSFLMEDPAGGSLLEFFPSKGDVSRHSIDLSATDPPPAARSWEALVPGVAAGPDDKLFVIRPRHLAEHEHSLNGSFVGNAMAHLREYHRTAVEHLAESDLHRRVDSGIQTATGYGLVRKQDVLAFLALQFTVGPAFDRHPAIRKVLEDRGVPADARMKRLAWGISEQQWNEARLIDSGAAVQKASSGT